MFTGRPHFPGPGRLLGILAGVVVLKVTASVVGNYPRYWPPDFLGAEFLRGREGYFFGWYRWAFYAHILGGPITLVLGLFLVDERSRRRWPEAHRPGGRIQVALVLLLVTPSGLAMAVHAAAGTVAAVGLASLALATATTAAFGLRAARRRRFASHRRWMWRCTLLLGSAVVLRLLGGLGSVLGVTASWYDPLAVWLCWLGPLAAFEVVERAKR